ncbi:oxygen-binding di-iron domain-containing protein [Halorarum salinum]|uniref:MBL fold metallo-hydrolase n=1 Tax=Halorarum salinum TaxID=2743089 RepID=A0A7D5QA54_9EURY|nr:MBL fold metallo-hydrolase [Halobaculum salinum]QLG61159.1 MBL fold metallo-hydrolase [Halobaculum salinum]
MYRQVEPGMYWLQECAHDNSDFVDDDDPPDWYDVDEELHVPQSVYLFDDEDSLLFDTFSPASTDDVLGALNDVLDGGDLDYLVVSHPDVPHAGNTLPIMEEYPDVTLVAPAYGQAHELYHLDEAELVEEGDTIELGTYTVEFHEAPFLDSAIHLWMSEVETNTLFTVDWHGFPHVGSKCLTFVDEFEHDLTGGQLKEFHGRVMFWLQYVDAAKVNREIDHVIETHDPDVVAPAHGNVIREDAAEQLRLMKDVVEQIRAEGRIGTFG